MSAQTRLSARDAIIEAGFQTFAANPTATLEDIAAAAGVGRATLHRHFSGRGDLMETLALTALEELDEAAETAAAGAPSYTSAMKRILEALIPLGDRHGFIWREPVEALPAVKAEMAKQQRETEDLIAAAQEEGAFHPSIPATWIAHASDNLIYAAWEMVRLEQATPKQAAALAWATLTNGLKRKLK